MRPAAALIVAALVAPSARSDPGITRRTLGVTDGLAHAGIRRIVTDSRGFIWFCTAGGLSRFDGSDVVSYGVAEGLSGRAVNDIVEDEHRAVHWIGTAEGLFRLARTFRRIPLPLGG